MPEAEQPIIRTPHHHKVTVIVEDLVTGLIREITMEEAEIPQVTWVEPEEKGISIFDLSDDRPATPKPPPKFMMVTQPVAEPGGEYVRVKVTNPDSDLESIQVAYHPF